MRTRWAELAWSSLLLAVGSLSLAAAWQQWTPLLVLPLAALLPLLLLVSVLLPASSARLQCGC